MGKLYDLVKLRNSLINKIGDLSLTADIENKLEVLNSIICKNQISNNINLENIKNKFTDIELQNQLLIASIENTIRTIEADIENYAESLFFNDSYQIKFSEPYISQTLYPSIEIENRVKSKITDYCNWRYPALLINPRSKNWIDPMVASDPLYLTHIDINAVKDLIKEYPNLYQNRLRLYDIIDRDFSKLPQNQFGFVLCWDNFDYLSLDKIKKYISEVWNLLITVGTFMFSYNNCDIEGSANRIEQYSGSYSSAGILTKLFDDIGYELIALHDDETDDAFYTHISWVEVKKPGTLKTVKAHQATAQIIEK